MITFEKHTGEMAMRTRVLALAGASALVWTMPAMAQQGSGETSTGATVAEQQQGLEDIVVTAQR